MAAVPDFLDLPLLSRFEPSSANGHPPTKRPPGRRLQTIPKRPDLVEEHGFDEKSWSVRRFAIISATHPDFRRQRWKNAHIDSLLPQFYQQQRLEGVQVLAPAGSFHFY